MFKVVGVGSGDKSILESFDKYPEYKTFHLDEGVLGDFPTMEQYEEKFPVSAVRKFLKSITKNCEVLYVVEGGAPVTGASLRILEILKRATVSVLYLSPDKTLLGEQEENNEELVFMALQDIVRSGGLKEIFLVDMELVEATLGDVPLEEYDKMITENIVTTFAMLNYFDHVDPVKTTKKKRPVAVRVGTFGFLTPEGEEFPFFNLQNIKDKEYCYGITKEEMKESSFLQKAKKQVKSNSDKSRCSFSIYSIDAEENQGYLRAYTDICQTRTNDPLPT